MGWVEVESSALKSVKYEGEARYLYIIFKESGHTFRYADVPEEIYLKLLEAASKGTYFNFFIKGKYEYIRISD